MSAEISISEEFQVNIQPEPIVVLEGAFDQSLRVLVEAKDCSITFDPATRVIAKNGEELARLTKSPAKLLSVLAENPNEFISDNELALKIWGDNFRRRFGVHNLISRVRETLSSTSEPLLARKLGSKKKFGYAWITDPSLLPSNLTFKKNI